MVPGSRSVPQIKSAHDQPEPAQEQQRRQIGMENWQHRNGQIQRTIAAGKIANHCGQEHEQQAPPDVTATPVRCRSVHARGWRHRLTAIAALRRMSRNLLATERTFTNNHTPPFPLGLRSARVLPTRKLIVFSVITVTKRRLGLVLGVEMLHSRQAVSDGHAPSCNLRHPPALRNVRCQPGRAVTPHTVPARLPSP